MKNFIKGIIALMIVLIVMMMVGVIFLTFLYTMGWSIGWLIHLMVGPDIILGLTFEQFIGMGYMIFVSFFVMKGMSKKEVSVKDLLSEKMKYYRGY